jgi:hypothetical protein
VSIPRRKGRAVEGLKAMGTIIRQPDTAPPGARDQRPTDTEDFNNLDAEPSDREWK